MVEQKQYQPNLPLLSGVGEAVKERREKKGYTQQKLAKRSGLHYKYIQGVESGARNLSVSALNDIASGFNMKVSALLRLAGH